MKAKYTPEMEEAIRIAYTNAETDEERDAVVDDFVELWGKSRRMIIAKLSRMKIYKAKERISKITGEKPETKEQMVRRLEKKLNYKHGEFEGLEKAPKLVLKKILEA